MPPILFLLPDLAYRGHARQASLLASSLPGTRFAVSGFSLNGSGPFSASFQRAGAPIHGSGGQRFLDLQGVLFLRRRLTLNRPSLIHAWGLDSLRALRWATLLKRSLLPPLVVSLHSTVLKKKRLRWIDRRLLAGARAIVVANEAERSAFLAAGIPAAKLRVVRPGVPLPDSPSDGTAFRLSLGIPADARLLMGVGHFNAPDRFFEAVWAFEFLQFVNPELKLVLIGEGPFRDRPGRHFRSARPSEESVFFLGERDDAARLIGLADIAVVPHRRSGGTFAILEAMAAGGAVVATQLPHLANLIRSGETGLLVPPADSTAVARAIRRLLQDDELRRRIGMAARSAVEADFTLAAMTARFAELYDEILLR